MLVHMVADFAAEPGAAGEAEDWEEHRVSASLVRRAGTPRTAALSPAPMIAPATVLLWLVVQRGKHLRNI